MIFSIRFLSIFFNFLSAFFSFNVLEGAVLSDFFFPSCGLDMIFFLLLW
jgi:hypothetical protein